MVSHPPFFAYFALVFGFSTTSLLALQVVTGVRNLMQERTHLFYRLEAIETMRAYIAHNMDGSEDLHARLKTIESKVIVALKLAKKGASLLRKAEKEKETAQVEAR